MSFVATLILTLILTAVPWPLAGLGVVPHWGFLLIAWWGIARHYQFSMILAFLASIPVDVIYGTPLGFHALLFSVMTYLLSLSGTRVWQVNWLRQMVVIFPVLLVMMSLSYWARVLLGQDAHYGVLFLQSVTTAVAWPVMRSLYDWVYDHSHHQAEGT